MARAFAWHARGHRFDSDILHSALRSFSEEGHVYRIKIEDEMFLKMVTFGGHFLFQMVSNYSIIEGLAQLASASRKLCLAGR